MTVCFPAGQIRRIQIMSRKRVKLIEDHDDENDEIR